MSIIATTNSTCTIKKIEYRGAEAIIHLKIVAFAKTSPEKGVMIYLRDSGSKSLIPAFKVSSEDDVYQNKIFWINTSNLTGHTYQNIGMDTTIPVHVDLSKGTYKDNHLYREITIIIVDYHNEKDPLWISPPLHLCSGPIKFDIIGDIIPRFTKVANTTGSFKYSLSIDYKFSENSWLFNLQHEDLYLEMSVHAKQGFDFDVQETVLAKTSGTWQNVSAEIEESAHVIITAKLKLNNSTVWQDQITCVPGELSTLYIKKDNDIYIITHKSLQHNALTRDIHIYHSIKEPYKLELLIIPWVYKNGIQRLGNNNQPLYTISPYVQNSYGKYVPLKGLFSIPITFSRIYWNNGEELAIPYNLIEDISEDFPTVIYNNYDTDIAERILSQMSLLQTSLKIAINGVTAIKQPILLIGASPSNYIVGSTTTSCLYVGSEHENYSLLIQKGDMSYD